MRDASAAAHRHEEVKVLCRDQLLGSCLRDKGSEPRGPVCDCSRGASSSAGQSDLRRNFWAAHHCSLPGHQGLAINSGFFLRPCRDEKVKVLRACAPVTLEETVLGQYTAGAGMEGYLEDKVPKKQKQEHQTLFLCSNTVR